MSLYVLFRRLVHLETNILSSFTHLHVVPNPLEETQNEMTEMYVIIAVIVIDDNARHVWLNVNEIWELYSFHKKLFGVLASLKYPKTQILYAIRKYTNFYATSIAAAAWISNISNNIFQAKKNIYSKIT